jgi:hypothetical protein
MPSDTSLLKVVMVPFIQDSTSVVSTNNLQNTILFWLLATGFLLLADSETSSQCQDTSHQEPVASGQKPLENSTARKYPTRRLQHLRGT